MRPPTQRFRQRLSVGLCVAMTAIASAALAQQEERPDPILKAPIDRIDLSPAQNIRPPAQMRRGRDGKMFPLRTYSNTANSRPQRAGTKQNAKAGVLEENQALGEQGVRHGSVLIQPFGSKGERVGIAFGSGDFVPPTGERIQPALLRLAQERVVAGRGVQDVAQAPAVYALLLLNDRMSAALRQTLTNAGVELFDFYPYSAFTARIPVSALNQVAALPQVRWIGQPGRAQKMEPALQRAIFTNAVNPMALSAANRRPGLFPVYIALFGPDTDEVIRDTIRQAGGTVNKYSPGIRVVQADVDAAALERILAMDAVLYTELVPVQETFHTQSMASINADNLWGDYDPLPTGSAAQVRVGIMDSGVYFSHNDFDNVRTGTIGISYIPGESVFTDLDGHGSHVAGTIIGEGRGSFRYRGVAAGLRDTNSASPDFLVSQVFDSTGHSVGSSVMDGLEYMNGETGANRIRQVFNYSGGGSGVNLVGTDTGSRKVDEIFANNVLPVVAAGNSGPGANTVATPGVAKGALTVGSIYNNDIDASSGLIAGLTDSIANTSSRGPTGDSRIKPDVVAPGRYIDSVARGTSNGYAYDWSGTSMATPHVTGLAAGIIGHFQGDGMPAWAVKAVLIASAIDIGLPSSQQGRGKVDAMLAHYSVDGGWSANWSSVTDGDVDTIDFTLSQTASQVKIVLVYPDPPAAAGAGIALVNDVDLGLQTTGALNDTWASRNYTSSSSRDNVEVITVNNLAAGTYRIKIHGYSVSGSQPWAVCRKVIYGDPTPNTALTFETPYAVRPNFNFYAKGFATAGSYVASGVYGKLDLLASGMALNGVWYNRQSKPSTNDEWAYFDNPDPGTAGWYNPTGMNMGNIADARTRQIWWSVQAGAAEGTRTIRFTTRSSNGGTGTVNNNIIVDGTLPVSVAIRNQNWFSDLKPDVIWSVSDARSGLDVSTAEYRYSTDGGVAWSAWTAIPCTGSDGTTAGQLATASNVPFSQNNNNNRIQFRIDDMAGNTLTTASTTITTPMPTNLSLTPALVPMTFPSNGRVTLSGAAPASGALVYLNSSNAAIATVPATVTVASGSTLSPFFVINTAAVAADTNVTISATYGGVTRNAVLTVKKPISVAGKITLQEVVNSVQLVRFEFRPTDGSPVFVRNVILNAAGNYSLSNIPARQYNVWIKGAKWLAQVIAVNATAGNVANANATLPGGDANNDNAADALDLATLITAFNTASGDPSFDADADFNCDGSDDALDLAILITNFNQEGMP